MQIGNQQVDSRLGPKHMSLWGVLVSNYRSFYTFLKPKNEEKKHSWTNAQWLHDVDSEVLL